MAECEVCERPQHDTAWVCSDCSTRLATALATAAELWPELDVTITRQARTGTPGPRSRSRAPAAPIRPGGSTHYADQDVGPPSGLPYDWVASEAAWSVRNTVTTWARHVQEQRGTSAPTEPAALLRWLAGQLEWLRYQPFAAEAFGELAEVHRQIRAAVDLPMEHVDYGTCLADTDDGTCQARLSAPPHAQVIQCRQCRASHDVGHWKRLLLERARDIRGTAAEVARWLTLLDIPTSAAVVRGLAHRHRVLADRLGRYRLGDVEDVRREQDARGERVTT